MPTAGAVLAAALRTDIARLVQWEPAVVADEPDAVHQMRVTTRRLRSVLASYRPLLDPTAAGPQGTVPELRGELSWLARVLGVARDAEVRTARFVALADQCPPDIATWLIGEEKTAYTRAHADIRAALASNRYHDLRNHLHWWGETPPLAPDSDDEATIVLPHILRRDRTRVRRLIRRETTIDPEKHLEALHEIRKSAKRLRYSAEVATATLGPGTTEWAHQAKTLQTILGNHRDAIESQQRLQTLAERAQSPTATTHLRLLAARERQSAAEHLLRYPEAAAPFLTT